MTSTTEPETPGTSRHDTLTTRFNAMSRPARMIVALLIAVAAGYLASLAHIPLPWLLGSLTACAVIALSGFDLGVHDYVRRGGQIAAGFSVGVFFTPEVQERVLDLGWLMVVGGVCSIIASVFISMLFARVSGCDRTSSFFAMIPGGLAEMAGLAHQFGANITVVALSQSLRIVTIVFTLPPALTLIMRHSDIDAIHPPAMETMWVVIGLVLATACAFGAARLKIFNPWLIGGLIVGIGFGATSVEAMSAPTYVRVLAQLAIGAALGARFKWDVLRALGVRFLPISICATLLLICVNVFIAWMMSSHLPFATGVLATAPGGIAEMSLTAEALNLAPPLVTAWQLVRILLVALLTGPLFKLFQRMT
ncbi:AbrB family transcriptional regulator [Acuticoccus sp. M5D2P5]|uniref:AbrB family transcriptional regulator n=1 Tax=Acuticoccus kalidii TaxID=2910977 RepID=UPI001F160038|nr:AbrB family transcriptional regulator [Acuticoccus kalidii]MCF3936149.1 AbrB family transcriptional regulator [Acuticoccus kalidii]